MNTGEIVFTIAFASVIGGLFGFIFFKFMWKRKEKKLVNNAVENIRNQDMDFVLDGKKVKFYVDADGIVKVAKADLKTIQKHTDKVMNQLKKKSKKPVGKKKKDGSKSKKNNKNSNRRKRARS